jgi:dTMP kinase
MSIHNGTLIVIEGIDGSGKTTLAQALAQKLEKNGIEVLLTKEPGGSNLGKTLRHLLQNQPVAIAPIAEYLLFAADRAQHINEIVLPALKRGATVISDRMADSSLVYQGYGRGLDKQMIATVNNWAMQELTPDIVIYLKIDRQTAASRLEKRASLTAFEKEKQDFTNRLVTGFDELLTNRSNVITLDGTLPASNIVDSAYSAITSWQQ